MNPINTVSKSLAVKLIKVMSNIKRVSKNGTNSFHNYDYVTEADILEAVRGELIKENVFIFSSVVASHKEGDMTSVQVKNTFVDGDTGESFEVMSLGQGQDKTGDKGAPKAITSASKYFLMKNFLIATGDDPEATDESGKSTAPKKESSSEKPKRYGFSNKAKMAAVPKAETTEVTTDEF